MLELHCIWSSPCTNEHWLRLSASTDCACYWPTKHSNLHWTDTQHPAAQDWPTLHRNQGRLHKSCHVAPMQGNCSSSSQNWSIFSQIQLNVSRQWLYHNWISVLKKKLSVIPILLSSAPIVQTPHTLSITSTTWSLCSHRLIFTWISNLVTLPFPISNAPFLPRTETQHMYLPPPGGTCLSLSNFTFDSSHFKSNSSAPAFC